MFCQWSSSSSSNCPWKSNLTWLRWTCSGIRAHFKVLFMLCWPMFTDCLPSSLFHVWIDRFPWKETGSQANWIISDPCDVLNLECVPMNSKKGRVQSPLVGMQVIHTAGYMYLCMTMRMFREICCARVWGLLTPLFFFSSEILMSGLMQLLL